MKSLCFGGSFNPIHHGHLICARAAAEALSFDRVLLIPTAQPPHKPADKDLAPSADRLEMCRLAIAGSGLFDLSDIELARTGPSYSIDTAVELKRHGWDRVAWLIGADMLLYLPKWHNVRQLLQEVDFIVMARRGWDLDWQTLPPEFRHLQANVVKTPTIDISATEIRARVAGGREIDFLTPPSVVRYIHDRGLYR